MKTLIIKAMGTVIRLSIEHQHPDTLLQEAEIKIRAWESQFSANDPKSDLMNV
ncbi:FAD:protein FMN transferase, partial [Staphylococcus epidermidis]|nr:FAD:protein FMN transferase [Staphylococcus epidermidis]